MNLMQLDPKNQLFDIVMVDRADHYENLLNCFQGLWSPQQFELNTVPFGTMIEKVTHNRASFVHGRLKRVNAAENSITLATTDGENDETVSYDILLICTGGSYCAPMRSADDTVVTLEQRRAEVAEVTRGIEAAGSVLCVGAGATGIETSCYLKEFYPQKTIGIAMRGDTLLKRMRGAHPIVERNLRECGVNIHYNTAFSDGSSVPLPD